MKSLAKFAAPVAVAFAAFGAQASEVSEWDTQSHYRTGSRSVVSAPQAPSSQRPVSFTGEIVPGGLAAAPVEAGESVAPSAPTVAKPAQGVFAIGA